MNEGLLYAEEVLSRCFVWCTMLVVILLGVILVSMLLTPVNMKEQAKNFKKSLRASSEKVFPYVLAGVSLGMLVTLLAT